MNLNDFRVLFIGVEWGNMQMNKILSIFWLFVVTFSTKVREKARGQLGRNSGLMGQNVPFTRLREKKESLFFNFHLVIIHARGGCNLLPLHLNDNRMYPVYALEIDFARKYLTMILTKTYNKCLQQNFDILPF